MECPVCEEKTKTIESRPYMGTRYRRRECIACGYRFWTVEEEADIREVHEMMSAYRMRVYDEKKRRSKEYAEINSF